MRLLVLWWIYMGILEESAGAISVSLPDDCGSRVV